MRAALILAALLLCATSAFAGEWHLQLHGVSTHDKPRANGMPWNEKNHGAGVRYQFNYTWGVQAGGYRNSYDRNSEYLMAQYTPLALGPVRAGVFAGYLTGYGFSVPAGAGVMATWQRDRLSITARYVPKVKKGHASMLAAEIGLRF